MQHAPQKPAATGSYAGWVQRRATTGAHAFSGIEHQGVVMAILQGPRVAPSNADLQLAVKRLLAYYVGLRLKDPFLAEDYDGLVRDFIESACGVAMSAIQFVDVFMRLDLVEPSADPGALLTNQWEFFSSIYEAKHAAERDSQRREQWVAARCRDYSRDYCCGLIHAALSTAFDQLMAEGRTVLQVISKQFEREDLPLNEFIGSQRALIQKRAAYVDSMTATEKEAMLEEAVDRVEGFAKIEQFEPAGATADLPVRNSLTF